MRIRARPTKSCFTGEPVKQLTDCQNSRQIRHVAQNWNNYESQAYFMHFLIKNLPLSDSEDYILRPVFSTKPTDPVIARSEATRQSLTKRFAIPKRTMAERNEIEPWNEERGNGTKRRISFFINLLISIPFCFVLPCFAAGCHTINFKIATAAMRPRNDTKLGRFTCYARVLTYITARSLAYLCTPAGAGCLTSELVCSLPACRKRLLARKKLLYRRAGKAAL